MAHRQQHLIECGHIVRHLKRMFFDGKRFRITAVAAAILRGRLSVANLGFIAPAGVPDLRPAIWKIFLEHLVRDRQLRNRENNPAQSLTLPQQFRSAQHRLGFPESGRRIDEIENALLFNRLQKLPPQTGAEPVDRRFRPLEFPGRALLEFLRRKPRPPFAYLHRLARLAGCRSVVQQTEPSQQRTTVQIDFKPFLRRNRPFQPRLELEAFP